MQIISELILYLILSSIIFKITSSQSLLDKLNADLNITTRQRKNSNLDYINDLLQISKETSQEATVAVQAFSESVSRCNANVTCSEAEKQFFEVESKLKVATSAFDKTLQHALRASAITNKARQIINDIKLGSRRDLVDYSQQSIDYSLKNAGIAVKATSNALTHCELVVNVTCSKCPQGPPLTMDFPESSKLITDIKANISYIFGSDEF